MDVKVYLGAMFLIYIMLFHGTNMMFKGVELKSGELYNVGFVFVFTGFLLSIITFFLALWIFLKDRGPQ
jgi:hypothetical protein